MSGFNFNINIDFILFEKVVFKNASARLTLSLKLHPELLNADTFIILLLLNFLGCYSFPSEDPALTRASLLNVSCCFL